MRIDESTIRKVEKFNDAYRLKEKGAILNWFDITEPEGRFSLNDKLSDIMSTMRGKMAIMGFATKLMSEMKKNAKGGGEMKDMPQMNGDMLKMVGSFTILRLTSMVSMFGVKLTKEQLLSLNHKLNEIKKP